MPNTNKRHLPAPTFGRYALCLIYDGLVAIALWCVVAFTAMAIKGPNLSAPAHKRYAFDPDLNPEMFIIMPLAVGGCLFGYFVYSWLRGGQTLGMRAWNFGIQTSGGMPINTGQATIRFAASLISLLSFGLGFLWAVIDRQNRTWHDIISNTRIVQN